MSRIRFSTLKGHPLRGSSGNSVGKVADCVVRLLDGAQPQLTGVLLTLGRRDVFVSIQDVADVSADGVRLASNRVDTRAFERRPGEVLLARDVVGRAVIDMVDAELVRVGDVVLEGEGATWRVSGVVPSPAFSPLRALGLKAGAGKQDEEIEWKRIEPLVSHVPSAGRGLPLLRLAMLRPADIADIVEEASHEEGEEILKTVHQDQELEADVFEELNPEHQIEFLRERSDAEVARLLAEMSPDDAADLLMKLQQERRRTILELLPPREQSQLRRLLGYNPETAGGLMSTEVFTLPETATAGEAMERVRTLPDAPDTLAVIYTVSKERLSGAVPLARLVRATPSQALAELHERLPPAVLPDADIPAVAVTMADYNLAALPVVDREGHLLGVITYDDVIEAMLPEEWRWRGQANQEHRYEPLTENS